MNTLEELLGIDPSNPETMRATALADQDYKLIQALVRLRKTKGISQEVIGEAMGVSQPTVAAFERLDNDPKLSTIRRYAIAIGALVAHSVEEDKGQLLEGSKLEAMTVFMPIIRKPAHADPRLFTTKCFDVSVIKRTDFAMAA